MAGAKEKKKLDEYTCKWILAEIRINIAESEKLELEGFFSDERYSMGYITALRNLKDNLYASTKKELGYE